MKKIRSKGARARKHKFKVQRGKHGRLKEAKMDEERFWKRQVTNPAQKRRLPSQKGK